MDQRLSLEFTHATYEQTTLLNGLPPDVETGPGSRFRQLMHNADSVLDNKDGFFFESIDGTLIISFQLPKSAMIHGRQKEGGTAGGKTRNQERFANVFACQLKDMREVSLHDTVNKLETCIVSHEQEISGHISVDVAQLSSGLTSKEPREPETQESDEFYEISEVQPESSTTTEKENQTDEFGGNPQEENSDNGWETSPTTNDWETVSETSSAPKESQDNQLDDETAEFVASFWEAYRRNDVQLQADTEDIDEFRTFVDGTLSEFNYISNERKRSTSFDIVGGSLNIAIETGTLPHEIKELYRSDSLSVEALPTYEEEVKNQRKRKKKELQKQTDEFSEEVQTLVNKLEELLEEKTKADWESQSEAFRKVHTGELQQDDSGGRFSQIKGVVSDDSVDRSVVQEVDADLVDDHTVEMIAEEVVGDPADDGLISNKEFIVDQFDKAIDGIVDEHRVRLVQEVVDTIEEIRSSKAYQRAEMDE